MLQGVTSASQKCQKTGTPNFYRVTKAPRTAPSALHPKGAISASRQRHFSHAPTSFIWCRDHLAEMPLLKRTKGRATKMSQECQTAYALPNQFNGVIVKTQKCLDIVAPRERPYRSRRNANIGTPLPTSYKGSFVHRRNANR